jgi:hypothetical protein
LFAGLTGDANTGYGLYHSVVECKHGRTKGMEPVADALKDKIQGLLDQWQVTGIPGRDALHTIAEELLAWRKDNRIPGLWDPPPRMLGATLDDGWGLGIAVILKFAAAMGVETQMAGVLQSWESIADACRDFKADYVGLTVLQFDTEDDIIALRYHLPKKTRIIAGGPVFQYDPEFQQRTNVDLTARDVAEFIKLLLNTA